ncbi:MAG: efflux RND transporter permease subunit, partial [Candidatus Binataceae bacterium]
LFRPLAWTKTLAVGFSSLLAIAVVPLLMLALVRGRRLRTEAENPVARFFTALYLPVIRWCLHHRAITIAANALLFVVIAPLALLASFIPMYLLGISSNIMSLGGFALAIGVLVDASIVMVENGHRHLAAAAAAGALTEPERRRTLLDAARQVGRPIFYSLLIIVVSFLPVFLLEAQEGRLFRPLAWTKTLAVGFSSMLAIAVVPLLMLLLVRGRRLRSEAENPVARFFTALYLPVIQWCLRHRMITIVANAVLFVVIAPLALRIGSQFMPPLFEGSMVYMPTALPGLPLGTGVHLMQEQDRILRAFSEVESVFGTVGRADSATDNAPTDMFDTTVILKPRSQWPPGMTYAQLMQEMDAKLNFPGLSNSWTMPVESRLDMELTGIKTPVGLKIQGPDLGEIQHIGSQIEEILSAVPNTRSVFAERVAQGFYVDIDVNRAVAARYGLTVADVQQAITSAIGGETIATAVSGRERIPINVRYFQDYRHDLDALRAVLLTTPDGAALPLGEVASVRLARGPSMVRDEDGELTGYVYLDLDTADYGGYVHRAQRVLDARLKLPPGYRLRWSGEYSFQLRARERMTLIVPVVFGAIFLLLYMLFGSVPETLALILPCLYALTGGLLLQYAMGFNFSVAVAVGYIALFGIAVETGVVMVIYLDEALDLSLARGAVDREGIFAAALEGAAHRLRPKLMTVAVVIMSLAPILWESGIGADVMKPIAAPIVGGMVTSTIAVLVLVPVLFTMIKERALRAGRLRRSGMRLIGGDNVE